MESKMLRFKKGTTKKRVCQALINVTKKRGDSLPVQYEFVGGWLLELVFAYKPELGGYILQEPAEFFI